MLCSVKNKETLSLECNHARIFYASMLHYSAISHTLLAKQTHITGVIIFKYSKSMPIYTWSGILLVLDIITFSCFRQQGLSNTTHRGITHQTC